MSGSRENSPDWLRCFQAPTHSTLTLSSNSDSLPNVSPSRDDKFDSRSPKSESDTKTLSDQISVTKAQKRGLIEDEILTEKKRKAKKKKKAKEKQGFEADVLDTEEAARKLTQGANHSIWALSSDSESCPDDSSQREAKSNQLKESRKGQGAVVVDSNLGSPSKALKEKTPNKLPRAEGHTLKKEENSNEDVRKPGEHDDVEVVDGDASQKHICPQVSSSRIPLLLSDKVNRTKALVECEGESIDLSGDIGAVGRVVISDGSSGDHEMYLDLKGTIYRTKIVPSRTFCIVGFGQSEAKIEAIMNDFIQLNAQSNVYEAETMVEGTLEGFSFDSEEEAEKMSKPISHQPDQNEGTGEQINGKTKGKTKKSSGAVQKKGRAGGGKHQPAKRVRKKAQVPKKTKTKK